MNIVIKNQNHRILDSLNTEIIKTLTGEFSIEEVQEQLINLYYNKTIIDITAIRNYYDVNSVIAFLRGFDPTKVVLLLNDSEVVNSGSYLVRIIENGVYNFTRNAAGVIYLLDHPNTYENVIQYTKPDYVNSNLGYDGIAAPFQSSSLGAFQTNISSGGGAFASAAAATGNAIDATPYDDAESDGGGLVDTPMLNDSNLPKSKKSFLRRQRLIGVQNLTDHAGSTTLAYLMVKQLKLNYKAKGIEMNKQDFIYFRDSDLSLCTSVDDFKMRLKELADADVIVVDLNDFDASDYCDDILYLIDPGLIRLNKLMKKDSNCVSKVQNGKVVLNRSSVKQEDIADFEYESKFKVFFNMPNINDRKERVQAVDSLLYNLGFTKQNPSNIGMFGSIFEKK